MAANTVTIVMITGAASATLATAVSNYNTAVATLIANAGPIWNNTPICLQAGCAMAQDAAVANAKYAFYGQYQYLSAS